jgi:hypothetical protein
VTAKKKTQSLAMETLVMMTQYGTSLDLNSWVDFVNIFDP